MWTGSSSDFPSCVSKLNCPTEYRHRNPKGNYHMVTLKRVESIDEVRTNLGPNFTANHSPASGCLHQWYLLCVLFLFKCANVRECKCVFIGGTELLNWLKGWNSKKKTSLTLTHSSTATGEGVEREMGRESRWGSLEVDYWREAGNNEMHTRTEDEGDAGEDEG